MGAVFVYGGIKTVMHQGDKDNRTGILFSEQDQMMFTMGRHYELYKKLGAHLSEEKGKKGVTFMVWAPHAQSVHVTGSFNDWNETSHPMKRQGPLGIFRLFAEGVQKGDRYQFLITTPDGRKLKKADPFAMQAQLRPETASVVTDTECFSWNDGGWIRQRQAKDMKQEPLAIYECHIGSWKRGGEAKDLFYTYRQFADEITAYVKTMGYTHVELMGIAEHPLDESWGYQVTGYYAPTARYGTPEDFQYLVDTLHRNGIGVILDWVPAHFPKDAHGLAEFDGADLFECPEAEKREHPHWGTRLFYYGMNEIRSFMIANALYWIREFHVDGLRVDAVASLLYLDFGKDSGQWTPNVRGGNQDLDSVRFFEELSTAVRRQCPGALLIAEDSSVWSGVTAPQEKGGLGFSFKWNMGWMHDFCSYMKMSPEDRRKNHYHLTFGMSYHDREQYLLPLSHDEVVHMKGSMFGKMYGCRVDKYANLRVGYTYMFGHSGKKLLFMGQEFGQEREWSQDRQLDWELLENEYHKGLQEYVKELLWLYNNYPCMYRADSSWEGFSWLNADDTARGTYSFVRKAPEGGQRLLFLLNMSPDTLEEFHVGVREKAAYRLLLSSTEKRFGGTGEKVPRILFTEGKEQDGKPCRLTLTLPAYSALIYVF